MSIEIIRVMIPITESGRIIGDMPMDISKQCAVCAQWTRGIQCKAFPGGIPNEIIMGTHDHRQSYEGDNGIRFMPIERTEK